MSSERSTAKFPLLLPALQGLSLYGHLVSIDYFSDMLAVMQRLMAAPGLSLRARLACLNTAGDILR
jgi:nucleolar complex protein 3